MQRLFAVMKTRGARCDASRPIEQQEDWRAHADFMNALEAEGFVQLGGTFEETDDVQLVVRGTLTKCGRGSRTILGWRRRSCAWRACCHGRCGSARISSSAGFRPAPARKPRKANLAGR